MEKTGKDALAHTFQALEVGMNGPEASRPSLHDIEVLHENKWMLEPSQITALSSWVRTLTRGDAAAGQAASSTACSSRKGKIVSGTTAKSASAKAAASTLRSVFLTVL